VKPGHIPSYVRSTKGPIFGSKLVSRPSAQRTLIARCLLSLIPPSMNRVGFQLFLINSLISSLCVPIVSLGVTSRLFIEFPFLVFHIDHTVIDIRIRSLSESLVKSSLKDNAVAPLTRPVAIAGHCLSVVFLQMCFAVSHAWVWPSPLRFCVSSPGEYPTLRTMRLR